MKVYVQLSTILSIMTMAVCQDCLFNPDESVMCQIVTEPICRALGYNYTFFPNLFNHSNEREANLFLASVSSHLRSLDCSAYLTHFLCSAAYPLCFPRRFQQIHPCRELCVAVRESCVPELSKEGLRWPEELDCNIYSSHTNSICVWPEGNRCGKGSLPDMDGVTMRENPPLANRACTGRLIHLQNTSSTVFGQVPHCTEPCDGVYFDSDQHELLVVWIATLGVLTLLVSTIIFLTYILNFRRVPNLEAPIYYLALCYTIVSLTHIVSIAIDKDSLICDSGIANKLNESSLLSNPTDHPLCLVMFCVVYYFTLCTWSWWVVATVHWCVTSLRACHLSGRWRLCFHVIAWSTPLLFTLIALSLGHVSGDPTLKTCWIEKRYELPFLVAPLSCALIICSLLLIISFAKIIKLQKLQEQSSDTPTHSKVNAVTLVRVGLYCTVYLIPAGLLLCVYFYEYWFRISWETHYIECVDSSATAAGSCVPSSSPVLGVFMLKVAATLCMGVISVFWIIGQDLTTGWQKIFCLCHTPPPNSNLPVYTVKGKFTANIQLHHEVGDYPSNTTSTDSSV